MRNDIILDDAEKTSPFQRVADHVYDRFQERIRPDLDIDEAKQLLDAHMHLAVKLKGNVTPKLKQKSSGRYFLIEALRCALIVRGSFAISLIRQEDVSEAQRAKVERECRRSYLQASPGQRSY